VRLELILFFLLAAFFTGCNGRKEKVLPLNTYTFVPHNPAHTGIDFSNNLRYDEELNPYTFRNFFNGGGVGIGDVNNDGLPDIFLCGNQVPNRLYLNKGNFQFEDITEKAGLGLDHVWTTGVTLADVNADGWLDIYMCKSGPPGGPRRYNELFINNGNLTFSEKAKEYGLDFTGLSVHAAFFDYDRDGDLDCYLLNNSLRSVGQYDLRKDQRTIPDPQGGNKLLRNDGTRFTDVTLQAGIYSSAIGFGLGVAVADINQDGWPDLYIANDFFEKDYLYINQQNGTFSEQLEQMLTEISLGSMGADIADINNDGLPEIFVTEMLPETDYRLKTTSQFENWEKYQANIHNGYYRQFSRNVLQLNNANGTFSEIGRFAGVHATDWSWGALLFDMDNDGWKDIFVANGIFKDLLNQDYVNFVANPVFIRSQILKGAPVVTQLIDTIPSNKVTNYFFRNNGNLTFTNMAGSWIADEPSFSNGSAYGDLDNDGDLDLVINNVNMPATVLENKTAGPTARSHFIGLQLEQKGNNPFAVGSKVWVKAGNQQQYQELFPTRGFMSSTDYRLLFGLGAANQVDSVIVQWPDGAFSVLIQPAVNQYHTVIKEENTSSIAFKYAKTKPIFTEVQRKDISFRHVENAFSDFDYDRLLFIMNSNEGPCLCKGDINNDKLEDFYVGGAAGQAGTLFVQLPGGRFIKRSPQQFEAHRRSEDTACAFFDANGDGLDDLYVASGGREYSSSSVELADRLYITRPDGNLVLSQQILPHPARFESSSTVAVADFNKDGFLDLFVGTRFRPQVYGVPSESYLLLNDGSGKFSNVTDRWLPALKSAGMITAAAWADVNLDGWPDLLVAGEWMPIRLFINQKTTFTEATNQWSLAQSGGWYNAMAVADLNADGLPDVVAGNHGLNSMFKATPEEPLAMWVNDFDRNGTFEQIIAYNKEGKFYPYALLPELLAQIPSLKKQFLYYHTYAGQPLENIFPTDLLSSSLTYKVYNLSSAVWLNTGSGFKPIVLPDQAQFFPVYAIQIADVNADGHADIVLGGNQSRAKPQTGTYQAGYGQVLVGKGDGTFTAVLPGKSGVSLRGDIRNFITLQAGNDNLLIVAVNNEPLYFFKFKPQQK
jgi:hypothetical protein